MKTTSNNKNKQLIAMLKKQNGICVSLIVEKLDWQANSVRAAISGLGKNGYSVSCAKLKKTGEAVYSLIADENSSIPKTSNVGMA